MTVIKIAGQDPVTMNVVNVEQRPIENDEIWTFSIETNDVVSEIDIEMSTIEEMFTI